MIYSKMFLRKMMPLQNESFIHFLAIKIILNSRCNIKAKFSSYCHTQDWMEELGAMCRKLYLLYNHLDDFKSEGLWLKGVKLQGHYRIGSICCCCCLFRHLSRGSLKFTSNDRSRNFCADNTAFAVQVQSSPTAL